MKNRPHKDTLIMYKKEGRESERDWLNLSNHTNSNRGCSRSRKSRNLRTSKDSTPPREVSPASYINVVTPLHQRNAKSGKSLGLSASEIDKSRSSLSELTDQRFPPKAPKREMDRRAKSRDTPKHDYNQYSSFFRRFPALEKHSKLVMRLALPKIHEHFKPKTWQFGNPTPTLTPLDKTLFVVESILDLRTTVYKTHVKNLSLPCSKNQSDFVQFIIDYFDDNYPKSKQQSEKVSKNWLKPTRIWLK